MLSQPRAKVQSLVMELRPHKPCGKKTKPPKKKQKKSFKWLETKIYKMRKKDQGTVESESADILTGEMASTQKSLSPSTVQSEDSGFSGTLGLGLFFYADTFRIMLVLN